MTYWSRVDSPVTKLRASAMAPSFGWSIGHRSSGVGHTSAPRSRSRVIFSSGAPEGIVIVHGMPRRLESATRAIPVLPEVGSTIFFPEIFPSRSNPPRRKRAVRSLIDPKGFIHSSLAKISPPPGSGSRLRRTSGVGFPRLPISCDMSSNTLRDRFIGSLLDGFVWRSRGGAPHEEDRRGTDTRIHGDPGQV